MVEAAANSFFHLEDDERDQKVIDGHTKFRAEFVKLITEIRGFADRRNDIAHGVVSHRESNSYLVPPVYNAKKYPMKPNTITVYNRATYRYGRDDIDYYRSQFMNLQKRLDYFTRRVSHIAAYHRKREQKS